MTHPTDGPLGGVVPAVTDDQPTGLAFPTETDTGAPSDEGDDGSPEGHTSVAAVAGAAAEQGGEVVRETGRQARQLMDSTREELLDQAAQQKKRVVGGLASLGDELRSMAGSAQEPGPVSDLAGQAASRLSSVGGWLEDREPGQLVDEARRFASRRPGAFLAIAVGAGILAGRATRGLAASRPTDAAAQAEGASSSAAARGDRFGSPSAAPGAEGIGAEWSASSVGGETR